MSKTFELPGGVKLEPNVELKRKITGDAWCETETALRNPQMEQFLALFIAWLVEMGYCPRSGQGRFNWVKAQIKDHFEGDAFDWMNMYIDGPRILAHEEFGFMSLETIDDAFGASPRRTMNRLKDRERSPRRNVLQDDCLSRMCWLTLAAKIWLARAGHPEFLEPFWP